MSVRSNVAVLVLMLLSMQLGLGVTNLALRMGSLLIEGTDMTRIAALINAGFRALLQIA